MFRRGGTYRMKAWTGELNQVYLPEGKVSTSDASVRMHPAGAAPDGSTRATKRGSKAVAESLATEPTQSTPQEAEKKTLCESKLPPELLAEEMPYPEGDPATLGPTFHRPGFGL